MAVHVAQFMAILGVRRMCESIGVNFTGQMRKLKSNPVYEQGLNRRAMSTIKGERESWFIDSELLQSWLTTIQVARVKPELREKLLAFKLEAAEALHSHFTKGFSVNEQGLSHSHMTTPRSWRAQDVFLVTVISGILLFIVLRGWHRKQKRHV